MCRAGLFLNFLGTNGRLLNYKRVSNTYWDCPSVSTQVQDLIGEWVSTSDFAHAAGINMEGVPKTIHLSRILHFEPFD